jgi:Ribonuclease G/E
MNTNPCPHCAGRGVVRDNRKLTDEQVCAMRAQLDNGEAPSQVAARFGVAASTARAIRARQLRKEKR